jgi:hypothetical protein
MLYAGMILTLSHSIEDKGYKVPQKTQKKSKVSHTVSKRVWYECPAAKCVDDVLELGLVLAVVKASGFLKSLCHGQVREGTSLPLLFH